MAEAGTLSPANHELGLTRPTLSLQLAAIGQRMCVALLRCVGKRQVLARSGLELLEHACYPQPVRTKHHCQRGRISA